MEFECQFEHLWPGGKNCSGRGTCLLQSNQSEDVFSYNCECNQGWSSVGDFILDGKDCDIHLLTLKIGCSLFLISYLIFLKHGIILCWFNTSESRTSLRSIFGYSILLHCISFCLIGVIKVCDHQNNISIINNIGLLVLFMLGSGSFQITLWTFLQLLNRSIMNTNIEKKNSVNEEEHSIKAKLGFIVFSFGKKLMYIAYFFSFPLIYLMAHTDQLSIFLSLYLWLHGFLELITIIQFVVALPSLGNQLLEAIEVSSKFNDCTAQNERSRNTNEVAARMKDLHQNVSRLRLLLIFIVIPTLVFPLWIFASWPFLLRKYDYFFYYSWALGVPNCLTGCKIYIKKGQSLAAIFQGKKSTNLKKESTSSTSISTSVTSKLNILLRRNFIIGSRVSPVKPSTVSSEAVD